MSDKLVEKLLSIRCQRLQDTGKLYDFPDYQVHISDAGDRFIKSKSDDYHLYFRKSDGFTAKWGRQFADNPSHSPFGNEIADIEITTACRGIRDESGKRKVCSFCFVEGTEITTSDGGVKKIEDVAVGDEVVSCNIEKSGSHLVKNEVQENYVRHYDGDVCEIELENGEIIVATPKHPFILKDGTEVLAEQLIGNEELVAIADFVHCRTIETKIKSMKKRGFKGDVYNFHCLPNENYFANGILVHNCYKKNLPVGKSMALNTFKIIFDKLNQSKTMTQIAFGVDAECVSNPDTFAIFKHARDNGVTPNVTVADITPDTAEKIVELCGAAAVSAYQTNKNCCYDSVKLLVDTAKRKNKPNFKCNIHAMLSEETYDFLFDVVDDVKDDSRLHGLNAIVFLSLKQRGRGENFNVVSKEKFKALFDYAMSRGVGVGFDSCSVPKFIYAISDRQDRDALESLSESCESNTFSAYINTDGIFYPCSFMEGMGEWKEGIDMTRIDSFVQDVWYDDRVVKWRDNTLKCLECKGYNECQHFNI